MKPQFNNREQFVSAVKSMRKELFPFTRIILPVTGVILFALSVGLKNDYIILPDWLPVRVVGIVVMAILVFLTIYLGLRTRSTLKKYGLLCNNCSYSLAAGKKWRSANKCPKCGVQIWEET